MGGGKLPLGYRTVKRCADLCIALVMLVLALPLMCVIALLIRLESRGSPIFVQQRVGLKGRPFRMPKFRTMYLEGCGDATKPAKDDPRVTRVGRVLRTTGLDELPQLWSVVRGDMSLVGPRPEMPFIVTEYNDRQRLRLEVQPGLTGLWQLFGDREKQIHEDIEYDLKYVASCSLWLDAKIMFWTFWRATESILQLLMPLGHDYPSENW